MTRKGIHFHLYWAKLFKKNPHICISYFGISDKIMMRILHSAIICSLCIAVSSGSIFGQSAQNPGTASGNTERFAERYSLLVSKLGYDGVGIETLLDAWEKEDSSDIRIPEARFRYYFAKSRRDSVVQTGSRKHLGSEPILTLKDSTGTPVYFHNEYFYNDRLFAEAMKNIGTAIMMAPERLDLQILKTDALCAYEKGSPDMALAQLKDIAGIWQQDRNRWEYPGDTVDDRFMKSLMQQYCALFYTTGTENSYSAFRALSEKMLSIFPQDPIFLANIGSYMLVAENNPKAAVKWYNKVLKVKPGDYAAIKNCIIAARKMKNTRLEKKYLPMLIQYGPESESMAAASRLEALNSK